MYMYKYTKIPHHKRYINGKKYYKRLKTRELKKKKNETRQNVFYKHSEINQKSRTEESRNLTEM